MGAISVVVHAGSTCSASESAGAVMVR